MPTIQHQQTIVHALTRAAQPLKFDELVEATLLSRELVQQSLDKLAEVYLVAFDVDQKTYQVNLPATATTPPAKLATDSAAHIVVQSVPQQVRQHLEAAPGKTLSSAELLKRVNGSGQATRAAIQHWRKKGCVRIAGDGWQWLDPAQPVSAATPEKAEKVPAPVPFEPAPVALRGPEVPTADAAELAQVDQTLARFTRPFRLAAVHDGSLEIQNSGGKLTLNAEEAAALAVFMHKAAPLVGTSA
ncbi:hypothetical protein [Chromobacterium haemolyticum]|uniref:hypothetical protein n=1 Tax=Chromobacterium haemolyticum TaxID=394935 RepID=UPI000D315323|nr:hypothetical protein [Chromobacterium haemolyticum]PTU68802.1 hypothetical protein DBB33_04780 [Chromobacterium haemolyticum]